MAYALTEQHLEEMFSLANFDILEDEMIFFGLRGSQPLGDASAMLSSHLVEDKGTDFQHMRCTIGQWCPGQGFALFPGSTVPNIRGVTKGIGHGGTGVNMLASCYLTDLPGTSDHRYRKGNHGVSSSLGPHRAFRNEAKQPLWRTGDDTDFEGDDRLLYQQAFDNIHCARHMDPALAGFSSLGCQVVAGVAGGPMEHPGGEKGPWRTFVERAYGLNQGSFRYALFNEGEAQRTVELGSGSRSPTVRFGSTGELAERLQRRLIELGHDIGDAGADGAIGFLTLAAIRDIQLAAFGKSGVDLVVGPTTAAEIDLDWPGRGPSVSGGGVGGIGGIDIVGDAGEAEGAIADEVFVVTPVKALSSSGKPKWVFDDPVDGTRRYIGGEARLQGFKGLARTFGFDSEAAPRYNHSDWEATHGAWAALIEPTGEGESRNSFTCLNSYDRAAFTFGFFQFAAHTPNDNLILLFRRLLELPAASRYFPDLVLSGGKVHRRTAGGPKSLEGAQDRPDGDNRSGEQGAFMFYLNGDMHSVDDAELKSASRLIHWACHDDAHRAAQVGLAVDLAAKKVAHIANKVRTHGASLNSVPMPHVAMALDILHNGRGGSTTFQKIASALKAHNVMAEMKKIGRTSTFAERIDRVADRAEGLLGKGNFGKLRYDETSNSFT